MRAATWTLLAWVTLSGGCTGGDGDDDGGDDDPGPVCGDGVCNGGETGASCAADCSGGAPVCGDGVCNGAETNASCAADCPSTGPYCGDGVCNASETANTCGNDCQCSELDAASCAGDTVCVAGACVAAFGRAYTIVAYDATIPQFKPDGSTWDAAGGAPDPYAVLVLNGTTLGMTSAIQDNFTPVWNQATAPTPVAAGSTFRIDVFDEDLADDDGVLSCELAPITADHLHAGVSCSGAYGEVTFYFTTL